MKAVAALLLVLVTTRPILKASSVKYTQQPLILFEILKEYMTLPFPREGGPVP